MKKILITILILLPQLILSQVQITKNEETILSRDKTIDIAKIIKNEERLQKTVSELQNDITKLNDEIQDLKRKSNDSFKTIQQLRLIITKQYDEIEDLSNRSLDLEKKKSNFGLYSFASIGSDIDAFRTFDLGFKIVFSKTIYSFTVDPIYFDKPVFKIGIGLKLL